MASLRLVPVDHHVDKQNAAVGNDNFYGVHDTLRDGPRTIRSEVLAGHPLESRLQNPKRAPVLKTSNLAQDILAGRDTTIEFEDFLGDTDPSMHLLDVHGAMERTLGHRHPL
ncbi:hypothetical protein HDU96_008574 [Phlyctochytrium bullatum]|nr:hypothetical protein HDU96_008574 [Phlyctochytrium bullatum]